MAAVKNRRQTGKEKVGLFPKQGRKTNNSRCKRYILRREEMISKSEKRVEMVDNEVREYIQSHSHTEKVVWKKRCQCSLTHVLLLSYW